MGGPAQRLGEDPPPDKSNTSSPHSTPMIDPSPTTSATASQRAAADGSSSPSTPLEEWTAGPRTTQAKGPPAKAKGGKGGLSFVRELPFLLAIAFLLALLIKTFLVQAFYIPSESMVPTLDVGDRVLVNKVVYHLHAPRRGDIIVFSDPHPAPALHRNPASAVFHWLTEGLGVTTSPDKDFIKRVIGLPGETIEMHRCVIYINGAPLHEPYLDGRKFSNCEYNPFHIPAGGLV